MSIQGAVPHNVPLQTAGDTIKLEFRPLSLHFTLFPPSSVRKIKVITVTFIKLRKQDLISLESCSESIPWVPSRTYPRLLPTHPFDAKDLAATVGMGGFGRRPRGQRESNPTWNAAWGGPRPRPFPAPPPPTWTPQLAGERTALMCGYRLPQPAQAAEASAAARGVLTAELCPLTAPQAGRPGSGSRPAAPRGLSLDWHMRPPPCGRQLSSLCVLMPPFTSSAATPS